MPRFAIAKEDSGQLEDDLFRSNPAIIKIYCVSTPAANLDAYKTQMVEMEDSFGSLLKQLPRDTEVPGLIDDISAAALSSGLKLSAIDPQKMQKTQGLL